MDLKGTKKKKNNYGSWQYEIRSKKNIKDNNQMSQKTSTSKHFLCTLTKKETWKRKNM